MSFPSPRGLTTVCPPAQTLTKTLSCSKFALARRLARARFAAAPGGRSLHGPTASPIWRFRVIITITKLVLYEKLAQKLLTNSAANPLPAAFFLMPEVPLPARFVNQHPKDTGITHIFPDGRPLFRAPDENFPCRQGEPFQPEAAPEAPASGCGRGCVAVLCLASHTHAFAVRRPGPER